MTTEYRNRWLILPLLFALLLGAISVTPARADDNPPPTEAPIVVVPVEESSDESQVMEETTVPVEESAPEDVSTQSGEVDSVSEILASAPEGTQIVVLDENGDVLPLASEEASETLQTADPIWCPSGVAVPVSGGSGCSPSQTSMTGLITWLAANNPNKAGTIWIEKIYDSSSIANVADNTPTSFTLDGLSLTNMANFALTIKGGWNGLTTKTVDATDPSSFVGDSLSIINWVGNITISDISVSGATVNPNGVNAGLYIETEGSVTLTRVGTSNNVTVGFRGTQIENAVTGKSGAVTITDSTFNANSTEGLVINSFGVVTIKGSLASNSVTNNGVQIDNSLDATSSAVTITSSSFNNNGAGSGDDGIRIISNGAVTLTDIEANGNGGSGAIIFTQSNSVGTAPVTLNGLNVFNENVTQWGLEIITNSAITIKHIVASGNGFEGVRLDATYTSGGSDTSLLVKPVTISGSAQVNDNGNSTLTGHGLEILSNGAVTLNNITAINNLGDGVLVDTDTAHSTTAASVTFKGTSNFNNNGGFAGLEIHADGNIAINNVTANDNTGVGVFLFNDEPLAGSKPTVTITGFLTALNNDFGLSIGSDGPVTANNLTTNDNEDAGTNINNEGSPSFSPVTINGFNAFNNNLYAGLSIYSIGTVTLNNITANGNGDTNLTSAEGYGVYIDNAVSAGVQQAVTLKGSNTFNGNTDFGLRIESYGAVTLSNVTANDNGSLDTNADGSGLSIINTGGTLAKPVTLTGFGNFAGNDDFGLKIVSFGLVTTNNLIATTNGSNGVLINNVGGGASAVTLNGVNFFNFNGPGLSVESDGAITLSKATAEGNTGVGIQLINDGAATDLGISLLSFATANNNGFASGIGGIQIHTNGAVTATMLTAIGNVGKGVYIINSTANTPKPVTISGNNLFQDNDLEGLSITSDGAVTLNNITAIHNGFSYSYAHGVFVANSSDPAKPQNVTFNGLNVFNNNSFNGLRISTYGTVLLNNITANGNGEGLSDNQGSGVSITNSGGTAVKPVTLKGTSQFNGNDEHGLDIDSDGVVTLSNITASGNGIQGVDITNTSPVQSNVTLTGYGLFENNASNGLAVSSNGSFTASNLNANFNGLSGVYINVIGIIKPQSVTLKGNNNFNYNGNFGLLVTTDGNITVSNITANYNEFSGAVLDNYLNWSSGSFATFGSVTQTGFGNFIGNDIDGLFVKTHGSVTLSYITANDSATGVGIFIYADGNATLTCTNVFNNFSDGLSVNVGGNLMLKGINAFLNGNDEGLTVGGTIIRSACP